MSKDSSPKWTEGHTLRWQEDPTILSDGAWPHLDAIDADECSEESKTVRKLSAIGADANWWESADLELRAKHGADAVQRFYEEFKTEDALRHRNVAIFGKPAIAKSYAGYVCQLVGEHQRSGADKSIVFATIRDKLANWLLKAIQHRDSQSLRQLAEILDDWPKDVPDFIWLERFAIKRAVDPRKSEKFLILKVFADCLQKDRRLPTRRRVEELRMVVGDARRFRQDMNDLGLAGLPQE